jgi:hypothetical protein
MGQTRTEGPRLTAYVTPDLRRRAERYAESQGISVSTLVLLALRAYLDEHAAESLRRRKA